MQEDAAELVRLRARTAPLPIDADQRVETLTAAATERGLVLDIKGDPTGIAVTGTGPSFDSFSQWLGAAHSEGLRVVSMEVLPEGTGVKVSARFAPQSL